MQYTYDEFKEKFFGKNSVGTLVSQARIANFRHVNEEVGLSSVYWETNAWDDISADQRKSIELMLKEHIYFVTTLFVYGWVDKEDIHSFLPCLKKAIKKIDCSLDELNGLFEIHYKNRTKTLIEIEKDPEVIITMLDRNHEHQSFNNRFKRMYTSEIISDTKRRMLTELDALNGALKRRAISLDTASLTYDRLLKISIEGGIFLLGEYYFFCLPSKLSEDEPDTFPQVLRRLCRNDRRYDDTAFGERNTHIHSLLSTNYMFSSTVPKTEPFSGAPMSRDWGGGTLGRPLTDEKVAPIVNKTPQQAAREAALRRFGQSEHEKDSETLRRKETHLPTKRLPIETVSPKEQTEKCSANFFARKLDEPGPVERQLIDTNQKVMRKKNLSRESGENRFFCIMPRQLDENFARLSLTMTPSLFNESLFADEPLLSGEYGQERRLFKREAVAGDGHCGFTALGITRQHLADLLSIEFINNPGVPSRFREGMHEHLITIQHNAFQGVYEAEIKLNELSAELEKSCNIPDNIIVSKIDFKSIILKRIDWLNENGKENEAESLAIAYTNLSCSEDRLETYLKSEKAFQSYIFALRTTLWLDRDSILFYAEKSKSTVRVWTNSPDGLTLFYAHDEGEAAQATHDLLFVNGNHYDKLVLQPSLENIQPMDIALR